MYLFYIPNVSKDDTHITFNKNESRHLVKVLRKKNGDTLQVTDGKGNLLNVQLISTDSKKSIAKIISKTLQPKRNYNLHLAVAPTKINDRYEWFLEKVTEIGIDTITPIICERSERKVIKPERFERIIQSAIKQSFQYHLPKLNPAIHFNDFIAQQHERKKFIAHCENTKKTTLKSQLNNNEDCIILIGPEGDFSVKEIETALAANYIPVTLGNTRLRTETAAVVACHSVSFVNQ